MAGGGGWLLWGLANLIALPFADYLENKDTNDNRADLPDRHRNEEMEKLWYKWEYRGENTRNETAIGLKKQWEREHPDDPKRFNWFRYIWFKHLCEDLLEPEQYDDNVARNLTGVLHDEYMERCDYREKHR